MGGNEIFWILDMGYGIWDTAYRLWIRSEPKTKAESEAPTIIYTIKFTYFMQGACYIQK